MSLANIYKAKKRRRGTGPFQQDRAPTNVIVNMPMAIDEEKGYAPPSGRGGYAPKLVRRRRKTYRGRRRGKVRRRTRSRYRRRVRWGSFRKMPKRRYRRRRRRVKRRRFRSSVQNISAPHTWFAEGQSALSKAVGLFSMWAVCDFMTTNQIESAWNDVGEGSTPFVKGSESARVAHCMKGKLKLDIRNLNEHPMFVRPIWLTCKRDIYDATNGLTVEASDLLLAGIQDRMLDADETTISLAQSGSNISSKMRQLSPFFSSRLQREFTFSPKQETLIMPGETLTLHRTAGYRKFRYYDITNDTTRRGIKGYSQVCMLCIRMATGHDTVDKLQLVGARSCWKGPVPLRLFFAL